MIYNVTLNNDTYINLDFYSEFALHRNLAKNIVTVTAW